MRHGLSRPATLVALLVTGSFAAADITLLSEDFESYADTSALNAVWPATGTNGALVDETYTEFISLDDLEARTIGANAFPTGGQGVEHRGQGILEIDVTALNGGQNLVPTASQSIVLQGDLFDVGGLGNKRLSIGMRSSSAVENIIELGQYNSDPIGYAYRGILFPSVEGDEPNPNWQFYELPIELDRDDDLDEVVTIGDIGEAWATYRATITPDTITYDIDLFRDGIINDGSETPGFDATISYDITTSEAGYDRLRFGGPSGIASAGNGFYGGSIFDNISLTLVDVDVPLNGDYNGDGFVDAADYTSWRDTLGDSVTAGEGADGNGNGVIDGPLSGAGNDYDVWANNYGAGVALGSAAAIPEPTALLLVAMGVAAATRRR